MCLNAIAIHNKSKNDFVSLKQNREMVSFYKLDQILT